MSKGVITLCHMSAPEAKLSYDMEIKMGKKTTIVPIIFELGSNCKS